MNDDLISRKALLKELREIMDEPHNTMFLMGIGAAVTIIEHCKTAFDKEKVKDELNAGKFITANGEAIGKSVYIRIDRAVEIVEKGGIG